MFASRAQAARRDHSYRRSIADDIVVSDRFTDSSLAYQGAARGIGMETVQAVHRVAVGSLLPDLTVCMRPRYSNRSRTREPSKPGSERESE